MDKKVIIIIVITLFFVLKKIRKIIGPLLLVLVFLFLFNNIKNIKSFFQTPKNEESTYSFLTLKNSDINTKENLKNKKIGYIESFMPVEIDEYVLKSYDANNIYDVLLKKEVDAIYISDSYLSVLKEEYKDILEQTKIVEEEKVESVVSIKESKNRDIINIFISGTDSKVRLNTFRLEPSLSRNVPTKLIFTMSADNFNSSSSKSISSLNFLIILLTIPIKICPDFDDRIATKWFTCNLESCSASSTRTITTEVSTLWTLPNGFLSEKSNVLMHTPP